MCLRIVFFLSLVWVELTFAQDRVLTLNDVRPTMSEMMHYHIENKQLSDTIIRRTFKIFIEQFDPEKLYFLDDEIAPYYDLTETDTRFVIDAYYRDNFVVFADLAALIHQVTLRQKKLRAEIRDEIIAYGLLSGKIDKSSYAKTTDDLKKRLRLRLQKVYHRFNDPEKAYHYIERKKRHFERTYQLGDEHSLTLHILKAMSRSLDAHTGYYSPDEAFEIRASLQKEFEGVGILLRETLDGVEVVEVIPGSPADRAGLVHSGDHLITVDGSPTDQLAFEEVLSLMKGEEGSTLNLTLARAEVNIEVSLVREKIILEDERLTYESVPTAGGVIGRISLPGFYDNGGHLSADRDLKKAMRELSTQANLEGIILDLRENSGGFLHQAVKIAGMFVAKGVVVISKYSDGETRYSRDLDGRKVYDGPLVILTSKASASAAEIVAQALQDYGVALVVGDERTYGKGSMQYQTITDEEADAYYKVTVGRYYTASGRSTQIEGVQADITVPSRYFPYRIGERYLEYPISSDHLETMNKNAYSDPSLVVPHLKPIDSKWRKMLPTLKANSVYRLKNNANFKLFLDQAGRRSENNFGILDLQMEEATEIIRDMISLSN